MYLRPHDWATMIEGAAHTFEAPKRIGKNQSNRLMFSRKWEKWAEGLPQSNRVQGKSRGSMLCMRYTLSNH